LLLPAVSANSGSFISLSPPVSSILIVTTPLYIKSLNHEHEISESLFIFSTLQRRLFSCQGSFKRCKKDLINRQNNRYMILKGSSRIIFQFIETNSVFPVISGTSVRLDCVTFNRSDYLNGKYMAGELQIPLKDISLLSVKSGLNEVEATVKCNNEDSVTLIISNQDTFEGIASVGNFSIPANSVRTIAFNNLTNA